MEDRKKLLDALMDVNDEIDYETETALVDDGLIDSLMITVVIGALNDAFGIQIKVKDIEPDNFNSLQGMLEMVRRYR